MTTAIAPQKKEFEALMERPDVRARFDAMLKDKAAGFVSSVLAVWKNNSYLKTCDAWSVISAAAIAASLDLPITPSLGFAAIVPYDGTATFQIMWKGLVQLAVRSGQYEAIHASNVYADEMESWDPLTAEFVPTPLEGRVMREAEDGKGANIIGYLAYFRLTSGLKKFVYMTKAQCLAHGKRYSQAFKKGSGPWVDNQEAMCLKTVVKQILTKWGILSVEMQKAVRYDHASIKPGNEPEYLDNPETVKGTEGDAEPLKIAQEKAPAAPVVAPPAGTSLNKVSRAGMEPKKAPFDCKCGDCSDVIEKGADMMFDSKTKKSYHAECPYAPE